MSLPSFQLAVICFAASFVLGLLSIASAAAHSVNGCVGIGVASVFFLIKGFVHRRDYYNGKDDQP